MDTNWRTDPHLLGHRRRRHRRHRCRPRRFASSTDAAVERGCPVSGPLTWILCSNQDLLLKYGTARERRKERQEQANGESDRTTRRGTEISREKDGEGEDSLLLVRHRSVVLQGAHGALPRGFSRDRSKSQRDSTRLSAARGWLVWGQLGRDPFVLRTVAGSFVPFAGNLRNYFGWPLHCLSTVKHFHRIIFI